MKARLFLTGLLFFLFAIALNAQEPQGQKHCKGKSDSAKCKHAVDTSKCKHLSDAQMNCKKGEMKGCCKEHNKNCKHFTDVNKDGICDHMQDSTVKK